MPKHLSTLGVVLLVAVSAVWGGAWVPGAAPAWGLAWLLLASPVSVAHADTTTTNFRVQGNTAVATFQAADPLDSCIFYTVMITASESMQNVSPGGNTSTAGTSLVVAQEDTCLGSILLEGGLNLAKAEISAKWVWETNSRRSPAAPACPRRTEDALGVDLSGGDPRCRTSSALRPGVCLPPELSPQSARTH